MGEFVTDLAQVCSIRELTVQRQQFIYQAGQPAEHLIFLRQGFARLFHTSPEGGMVFSGFAKPGFTFGFEACMREDQLYQDFASAILSCTVIRVHRKDLSSLFNMRPEWIGPIFEEHFRMVTQFNQQRESPLLTRLASVLLDFHPVIQQSDNLIGLTQEDFADAIGASRETTSRMLGVLEGLGAITKSRLAVTVLQPDLLEQVAAGYTLD